MPLFKIHHRKYAFRPPYREKETRQKGTWPLLARFLRTYVAPYRWPLILCAGLAAADACGSFFLLAYYSRVIVDKVLVIQPTATPAAQAPVNRDTPGARPWTAIQAPTAASRPAEGLGKRIDRGWQGSQRPADAGRWLGLLFLLYIGTMLAGNGLNRLASRLRVAISQRITVRLREDMHAKVMKLSLAYHATHTSGRLMARVLSDVDAVQDQLLNIILSTATQVSMIVVGLVLLLTINWPMAFMVILLAPFYALVYHRARPYFRKINTELRHTWSCLYGLVSQKLDAIKVIQAYGRENQETLTFHRLAACNLRDSYLQTQLSALTNGLAQLLSSLGTNGFVFLYGIHQVLQGVLTLGEMLYAYGTAATLFGYVLNLSYLNVHLSWLMVLLHRLAEVLDEPVQIKDAPDAVDLPAPLKQGITLNHVQFQYEKDGEPVLKNISLFIPAGTWLCVMGASGSGKTTLLNVLARLFEPQTGEVLLDGIPLIKIKLQSLRRQIALVPQEAQIMSGTVRDNICYGRPDASPREIMAAAQAAEFDEFVMSLPVQYETILGEKGASLSGGQKQRLSLARALLTQPEVLLLDDCTSALDAETERRIQETLARILVGKTAVIVSQRVSMAQRCHRICVLTDGAVSEFGAPAELLAAGDFYARLHAQQTG